MSVAEQLQLGRERYAQRAWQSAHEALSSAEIAAPLEAADIELLATCAHMIGNETEWTDCLERAHQAHLDAGDPLAAVRCAFWIGTNAVLRGDMGRASGWLGRAQRLLEQQSDDCVERGYLLIPAMFRHAASGNSEEAGAVAAQVTEIAERFGDRDLFGLVVHEHGQLLCREGRVAEGLALLDEAMVAVTSGELSPIPTGIVYCGVILACQEVFELRRAGEWTGALTRWCDEQPELVAFTGRCRVHRAEILQLQGAWPEALAEAELAGMRSAAAENDAAVGEACYRRAEVLRLQGNMAAAEEAYREASGHGWEPQPGLALLRLAQGDRDAAEAAIRRVAGETTEPLKRARLLPALVEIALSGNQAEEASEACEELERIAATFESDAVAATAAHARGSVDLAAPDPGAALPALRRAAQLWQELDGPYEAARARELVGLACRALGDEDAAGLELEAARNTFTRLGATTDLARLDGPGPSTHGLSPRELEVLRLVAAGETNKAIAARLILSERTIDRHVSNVFGKLRVSSRAAATAWAYEHKLI